MEAIGLGIEAEAGVGDEDDVHSKRRLVGVEYEEGESLAAVAAGLLLGSSVALLGCGEG